MNDNMEASFQLGKKKKGGGLGGLNFRGKKTIKLYLELNFRPSCDSRQLGVLKGLRLKLF